MVHDIELCLVGDNRSSAAAAAQGDLRLTANGGYEAPSPTSHIRPRAVTGHPMRIAVVRLRRYALRLCARCVERAHQAVGCCYSCLVIATCTWSLHVNSNLLNMLSGIPMLCGRTVARKQNWALLRSPEPLQRAS